VIDSATRILNHLLDRGFIYPGCSQFTEILYFYRRNLTGPVRAKPIRGGTKVSPKRKPKTAEELDNELDAFMGDAEESHPGGNGGTGAVTSSNGDLDLQME